MTEQSWEQEYLRRVTEVMTPEHYQHGFRADKVSMDAHKAFDGCDWMEISIVGRCPCGEVVAAVVEEVNEIVSFLEHVTMPENEVV